MAWSSPRTWTAGEIVTAAIMNTHVRDNLNYLKGNAGTVAIASSMSVTGSVTANPGGSNQDTLSALSGGSGNFAGVSVGRAASEARFFVPSAGGQFLAGAAAGDAGFRVDDSAKKVLIGAGATETVTITSSAVGIGTAAPAAKLHVVGAGGSFLFMSCNAVDGTLQTPIVAGTVTQSAAFWIYDRNNTGGATVQASGNMINALGGTFNLVNTDTITVTVTAGGAITVQRTAGTNGTHQVNALILFK